MENKSNKGLIISLIITILIIIGLGSYIVYDKFIKEEPKIEEKTNIKEEKNEQKQDVKEEIKEFKQQQIIMENNKEEKVVINGKNVLIKYTSEEDPTSDFIMMHTYTYINDECIEDVTFSGISNGSRILYTILGEDNKEYIVIETLYSHGGTAHRAFVIVNDKGEKIYEYEYKFDLYINKYDEYTLIDVNGKNAITVNDNNVLFYTYDNKQIAEKSDKYYLNVKKNILTIKESKVNVSEKENLYSEIVFTGQ